MARPKDTFFRHQRDIARKKKRTKWMLKAEAEVLPQSSVDEVQAC